jgi:hypothetical protein
VAQGVVPEFKLQYHTKKIELHEPNPQDKFHGLRWGWKWVTTILVGDAQKKDLKRW